MPDLHVGQKLLFVPDHVRHGPYEVTIKKVGRKWATLANNQGRIDCETLQADGGQYSSPGRCWLSRAEWEAHEATESAWSDLRRALYLKSRPDGVTAAAIRDAMKLLGLVPETTK